MKLKDILSKAPLTKSVPEATKLGFSISSIHATASRMGYTRRAVNYALHRSGFVQRRRPGAS
jgi:hypothetical protein